MAVKNRRKIEAILFDFVGVLMFTRKDYQPDKIVDEIDRTVGTVVDDGLFKKETMSKFNLGEKEFDAILEKIVNKYEPLKFLWNLLPALRKKYKLAIINNGTALTLREFENRYNIKVRFDLFVSSALEGIKKPRKDIYLSAASQLKVNPKNCLFMDDSELNIRGAKRCGMKTIWWKTQEDGIADFKKFIAAD